MQVQLEVIRGPAVGNRVLVTPGLPLLVGRNPEAGLRIANDPAVSREHCRLSLVPPDCFLTNLSNNGTLVNGNEISEALLSDGDEIALGEMSLLKVRWLRGRPLEGLLGKLAAIPQQQGFDVSHYQQTACPSGLTRFSSADGLPKPTVLIDRLLKRSPVYAIADFQRLGLSPPDNATLDNTLYEWLPPDLALLSGPILLEAQDPAILAALETGWGKNALILLVSALDQAPLVKQWRQALRLNIHGDPAPAAAGLLGICFPAILEQLLALRTPKFASSVLDGISAVLLETSDAPGGWQFLAPLEFSRTLMEIGLELDPQAMSMVRNK